MIVISNNTFSNFKMGSYYVYVMDNELYNNKFYKLGSTQNPLQRIQTYNTYYPFPANYLKLWKIKTIPDLFVDVKNHDDVVRVIMSHPKFGYNIKPYGDNGGQEFFEGDPNEIEKVLTDNGYELEEIDIDDIEVVECETQKSLSQRETIIDKLGIKDKQCVKVYVPKEHQVKALYKIVNHFESNDKCKIVWACGLGKTLLSLFCASKLSCTSICIGVPSKYLQEQFVEDVLKLYQDIENILCIGGDMINSTTDKNMLIEFLSSNKPYKFVITTYSSCHLVLSVCKEINFQFDMKIADEAHHLVCIENEQTDKSFNKFHHIPSNKTLFMTATEKVIDNKVNVSNVFSMDNVEIFGQCIDAKSVCWAIENKKITDYSVVVMTNTEGELDNIIRKLEVPIDNKELFLSAFMTLKAITILKTLTHILIYTNSIQNAILVNEYIKLILKSNMFDIETTQLLNMVLHSKSSANKKDVINKFKQSKYGIISCVYMFGEGFDLPKLNGVCFAENMDSDIRIVQSTLRPNRIEKDNPEKHAYVLLPYLDKRDWNDDNISFEKCRKLISKLRNVDETIEYKIQTVHEQDKSKEEEEENEDDNEKEKSQKQKKHINIDANELNKLLFRLRHSKALNSKLSPEEDEYNYVKCLNKELKLKSKQEYNNSANIHKHFIIDPVQYFKSNAVWKSWYDFLGVDTSKYLKTKQEWLNFCKSKNIKGLQDYKKMCNNFDELPTEPDEFYYDFTSIDVELGNMKRRF